MTDLWSLLPGGLLLFLPGYALSRLISRQDLGPLERVIVSVGLSLALMPLLLLWATLGGMSWGGPTAWALVLLSALVVVWTWQGKKTGDVPVGKASKGQPAGEAVTPAGRSRHPAPGYAPSPDLSVEAPGTDAPPGRLYRVGAWSRGRTHYLLLALVFAVSLAVRLWAIRDLSIPMWGDSLHHSWLARLVAERGQVPDSYYPYFPLDSATYHFGYHAMVAFFHWITGLTVLNSVLIFSQVLNALSALTVYLLCLRLTRSRVAALLSALVVGLISLMPAYYVNWGRYTQLAGQVVLPVAAFLSIEAIEKRRPAYLALASVSASGLFLIHYRVILFYLAFMAAYLAWRALAPRVGMSFFTAENAENAEMTKEKSAVSAISAVSNRSNAPGGHPPMLRPSRPLSVLGDLAWMAGVGVAALALAFPRVWYLAASLPRGEASVPQLAPEAWDQWMSGYNALGDVSFYLSWPLLALASLAFFWAVLRRDSVGAIMGAWVALLFLMANAERVGLGRGAWLNNFAVLIALYLPASVLIGWLGARTFYLAGRAWKAAPYPLAGLVVAAGLWGGWGMTGILDGQYMLATPADQRAFAWISRNTPQDARFLINYFFAYGGRFVVGSDGGWWIPYVTGREANVPPILYGAESSPGKDYAARTNALARSLEKDLYTRDGLVLMREEGITHVYVGEKGGFLDPSKLASAGHQPVYRDGPVWVFKLAYPGAGP